MTIALRILIGLVLASVILVPAALAAAAEDDDGKFYVQAARVHTGDGTVIEDGVVVIEDGKIVAVGPGIDIPDGANHLSSDAGVVTPGLIDAASTAGIIDKNSWTEHSSETVPHLRVLDAVDLWSRDFERLVREGVTSVYVTPGSGSVIGFRGCVLKTAGDLDDRVVTERGSVKASMGMDTRFRGARNSAPYGNARITSRRPLTRMAVTAILRQAFFRVKKQMEAQGGNGNPPADRVDEVLAGVVRGEIPLRIQARKDIDIWAAIRVCDEFGIKFVLEEGIEAYRCIPELKARGIPVVFGPIFVHGMGWRAMIGEANRPCLNTAGLLHEAGLPLAITASDMTGEGALPHQAGYAIRAGLPFEAALDAVTATPARLLGLEDRLGVLAAGRDADLVVWSGEPFAPTTRPVAVLVNGKLVHVHGVSDKELKELGDPDGRKTGREAAGNK
jgi:imidazolonepropionase-like amidohydrolase